MYKLEYLPSAVKDMTEIVRYISQKLQNPGAASSLADEMVQAADSLCEFPYAYPMHKTIRPLKHEYRRIIVQNYLMFYWVDEEQKTVTIARVIYARRDYPKMLN